MSRDFNGGAGYWERARNESRKEEEFGTFWNMWDAFNQTRRNLAAAMGQTSDGTLRQKIDTSLRIGGEIEEVFRLHLAADYKNEIASFVQKIENDSRERIVSPTIEELFELYNRLLEELRRRLEVLSINTTVAQDNRDKAAAEYQEFAARFNSLPKSLRDRLFASDGLPKLRELPKEINTDRIHPEDLQYLLNLFRKYEANGRILPAKTGESKRSEEDEEARVEAGLNQFQSQAKALRDAFSDASLHIVSDPFGAKSESSLKAREVRAALEQERPAGKRRRTPDTETDTPQPSKPNFFRKYAAALGLTALGSVGAYEAGKNSQSDNHPTFSAPAPRDSDDGAKHSVLEEKPLPRVAETASSPEAPHALALDDALLGTFKESQGDEWAATAVADLGKKLDKYVVLDSYVRSQKLAHETPLSKALNNNGVTSEGVPESLAMGDLPIDRQSLINFLAKRERYVPANLDLPKPNTDSVEQSDVSSMLARNLEWIHVFNRRYDKFTIAELKNKKENLLKNLGKGKNVPQRLNISAGDLIADVALTRQFCYKVEALFNIVDKLSDQEKAAFAKSLDSEIDVTKLRQNYLELVNL